MKRLVDFFFGTRSLGRNETLENSNPTLSFGMGSVEWRAMIDDMKDRNASLPHVENRIQAKLLVEDTLNFIQDSDRAAAIKYANSHPKLPDGAPRICINPGLYFGYLQALKDVREGKVKIL